MRKHGWKIVLATVAITAAFLPLAGAFGASPVEIQEGTQFNFTLPSPGSTQVQSYLGLKTPGPFKLSDVKAQMVVIELMSSTCPHCQASAPTVNNVYKEMQTDPGLADVKFFALSLSDNKLGLETFRKAFKTVFPILLDENHGITNSIKGLSTPTVIMVSTKSGKVLSVHQGEIQDADGFIKQVKFVKALEAMGQ